MLLCRPVNTDDLATCVRGHAPTLRRRSTLRADRTVPNRSIQKEVGKTGYEVIGGHCVWVEKLKVATNRRAADRDTCTEQKSCSRGDRSFSSLIFTPQHIKNPTTFNNKTPLCAEICMFDTGWCYFRSEKTQVCDLAEI